MYVYLFFFLAIINNSILYLSSFPFIYLSSLQFVTIYEHVFLVFVPLSMYGLLFIFGGYVSLMFKRLTHQSSVITDPTCHFGFIFRSMYQKVLASVPLLEL